MGIYFRKLVLCFVVMFGSVVITNGGYAEADKKVYLEAFELLVGEVSSGNKNSQLVIKDAQGLEAKWFREATETGFQFSLFASEAGYYSLSYREPDPSAKLSIIASIKAPEAFAVKYAMPQKGRHPSLDSLLEKLQETPEEAIADFWRAVEKKGAPLVHPKNDNTDYVTFIWRGSRLDYSVELLGSKRSMDRSKNLLANIKGTDIWFKTVEVSAETVMTYGFSANVGHFITDNRQYYYNALISSAVTDPLNDDIWYRERGKFGSESLIKASAAKEHYWSIAKQGVPKGTLREESFTSEILGRSRTISLYTPHGEVPEGLPLVFIFDGSRYAGDGATPAALDNLIYENKIPPIAAVFVHNTVPSTRGLELPCTKGFTNFLADELLPWVKERIPATATSKDIVTAGSSYGGLASSCANIFRQQVFNHVLSMSGSYWWYPEENSDLADGETNGWVVRRYAELGCNGSTKFYFDAGQLENEGKGLDSIGENSETLTNMLRAKGCQVGHQRFPGGHDLYHWKETIAHGLISLLGETSNLN